LLLLARNRDVLLVAATKHCGVVGDLAAAASSAITGSEGESWWVASAALPGRATVTAVAALAVAHTVVPVVGGVVLEARVKGVGSEGLVEHVQDKVRLDGARSDSAVVARVFRFAIDLDLFGNCSNDGDGVVRVGKRIASIIVLISRVHHHTSVPMMQNSAVLVHVVLTLSGASTVVLLKVTPAAIVPDLSEVGDDWVVHVDHVSLVHRGAISGLLQHLVDICTLEAVSENFLQVFRLRLSRKLSDLQVRPPISKLVDHQARSPMILSRVTA